MDYECIIFLKVENEGWWREYWEIGLNVIIIVEFYICGMWEILKFFIIVFVDIKGFVIILLFIVVNEVLVFFDVFLGYYR